MFSTSGIRALSWEKMEEFVIFFFLYFFLCRFSSEKIGP
jgi:hypothetical protein